MSLRPLPEVGAFEALARLPGQPSDDEIAAFDAGVVAAEAGDITLYGTIGADPETGLDNSERRIAAALRSIGTRDVVVSLNSPGGSFYSGLAIYNLLRLHRAKVTVQVVGMAGSAASLVAMAGDVVEMADGAQIMVHDASALVYGNRHDLGGIAEALAEADAAMATIYAARAGVEASVAAGWMDQERGGGTRFWTDEAIRVGLADRRLPKAAVRADATRPIPAERAIERALVRGEKISAATAKSLIADLKGSARDAASATARDAGFDVAAVERLLTTLRS